MIYLTGSWRPGYEALGLGMMSSPDIAYAVPDDCPWAADNGCFAAGARFDPARWIAWLDRQPRGRCLFAVAPDVVADAVGTETRSRPWIRVIRDMGYPPAYVAQDGMESLSVEWDFDVLFIGGSTKWKLSAHARMLAGRAVREGRCVHVGRVNSLRRMRAAAAMGAASCDGTFLRFGPSTNLPRLLRMLRAIDTQPELRMEMQHG